MFNESLFIKRYNMYGKRGSPSPRGILSGMKGEPGSGEGFMLGYVLPWLQTGENILPDLMMDHLVDSFKEVWKRLNISGL